jgi:hypothetical protein
LIYHTHVCTGIGFKFCDTKVFFLSTASKYQGCVYCLSYVEYIFYDVIWPYTIAHVTVRRINPRVYNFRCSPHTKTIIVYDQNPKWTILSLMLQSFTFKVFYYIRIPTRALLCTSYSHVCNCIRSNYVCKVHIRRRINKKHSFDI